LHSHNKSIGCGASGAYAPGPDDDEEEEVTLHYMICSELLIVSRFVGTGGFLTL